MISNIFARLNGRRRSRFTAEAGHRNSKEAPSPVSPYLGIAGRCNAGDTESCVIAIRIRLQIVPRAGVHETKRAAMPVENNVHHRAPVTVADRSGANPRPAPGKPGTSPSKPGSDAPPNKPGTAPSEPGPARPSSGNANSTAGTMPAVPIVPKIPGTAGIEAGLRDLGVGKITQGEIQIVKAIYDIVSREVGVKKWNDYDKAKPVTDKILGAYSGRNEKDFQAVVKGVNAYLQDIVVASFVSAKDESQFVRALETAVKYVIDTGPNSRTPADRLKDTIKTMRHVQIDAQKIAAVQAKCEQVIASQSK